MYVIDVPKKVLSRFNKVICDGCGSTLVYNSSDIITDYNYLDFADIMSSILGEKEMVAKYVVKCPICGEYINITREMAQDI